MSVRNLDHPSDRLRYIIVLVCLILFSVATIFNLQQTPINNDWTRIDEQGHISYALHLIHEKRWWPDFDKFVMYNHPNKPNYINHPPTFYWLAKLAVFVKPTLHTNDLRLLMIPFLVCIVMLYGLFCLRICNSTLTCALFVSVPLLCNMHMQLGYFNNDMAAFLGGMLVTYASINWFDNVRPRHAFWLMVIGVLLASVKLTAALLVGLYALCCVVLNAKSRQKLNPYDWLFASFLIALAAAPFLYFLWQYGSPSPETIGHIAFMTGPQDGGHWVRRYIVGWVQEQPMGYGAWLLTFFHSFSIQFERYNTVTIPILLTLAGFARVLWSRKTTPSLRDPMHNILLASLIATGLTLLCNILFAWPRYVKYGWLIDANVRYYFPLLTTYALASVYALRRHRK